MFQKMTEQQIESAFTKARLNRMDRTNVVPRPSDFARLRTCRVKVTYQTPELAERAADFMKNKHGFNFHKYVCPYCREYHIAKTWGKE